MKRVAVAIAPGLASVNLGLAGSPGAQPVTLRFGQVPSTLRAAGAE